MNRRGISTVAIALVLALLAVGCAGGSEGTAQTGAPSFDGAETDGESGDSEDSSESVAIATTAPLTIDEEPEPTVEVTTPELVDDVDPWEVTVLHVNDDVGIIPTFDGPNGEPTTLFDQNQIDNIQLEYPLLAETHFGNRLALLVDEFDPSGNWAKVEVPIRPNGTTTWVQTAFFRQETHNYHITIDVSDNKVNVYKGDDLLIEQIAVSGRESRPTPVVRSYIDEKIAGESLSAAYGDWVLSIAAFSEALGTFDGNMPKLALHGTNQPELMGQYVSSGCVRIPNEVVSFIAENVPVGTIVDIVA